MRKMFYKFADLKVFEIEDFIAAGYKVIPVWALQIFVVFKRRS